MVQSSVGENSNAKPLLKQDHEFCLEFNLRLLVSTLRRKNKLKLELQTRFYCGVGLGEGDGRSDAGITAGFGLSDDECK